MNRNEEASTERTEEENTAQEETPTEPKDSSQSAEHTEPNGNSTEGPEAASSAAKSVEEQLQEANDKYLRLYSDFENFRRRNAKERLDLISTASEEVVSAVLPILDDFERAITSNAEAEDIQAVKQGFELLHTKMKGILTQKGLKEMDVQEKEFDLDFHEAITRIPAPSKKLKGKIVDVVEKGYLLNEKVIRYAKVVVGE